MARQLPAKQFEVGSTPTGVSDRSTAGSDYISSERGNPNQILFEWSIEFSAQLTVETTSTPCHGVPQGTMSRQHFVGRLNLRKGD
jgi:hypothetical protein